MKCAKCGSEFRVNNGYLRGRQRYKCKDCGYNYSVELKSTARPEDVKRQTLLMYLKRLDFSSIGRILKVSHVPVLNGVRKYGHDTGSIRNDKPVEFKEPDELHNFIGHKKTIDGFGLVLAKVTKSTLILLSATEAPKSGVDCGEEYWLREWLRWIIGNHTGRLFPAGN